MFALRLRQSTSLRLSSINVYIAAVVYNWARKLNRHPVPRGAAAEHTQLMAELAVRNEIPAVRRDAADSRVLVALAEIGAPLDVRASASFGLTLGMRGCEYLYTSAKAGMSKKRIRVGHVSRDAAGVLTVTLHFRKNNADGTALVLTRRAFGLDARICPSALWGELCALRAGAAAEPGAPAFREESGAPLRATTLAAWLRRACAHCGMAETCAHVHSLRIGFATRARAQGMADAWIMQQGGWRSLSGMLGYCRAVVGADAFATAMLLGADAQVVGAASAKRRRGAALAAEALPRRAEGAGRRAAASDSESASSDGDGGADTDGVTDVELDDV